MDSNRMDTQNFVRLDPLVVVAPKATDSDRGNYYRSTEFARLKKSIEHVGGNAAPIKVRPAPSQEGRFEIVFGHARHRACLDLGLPVAVVVEEMSRQELVNQFVTHQLFKKWDPVRLGEVIGRAIDDGLYSSLRRAAESLGMDQSTCSLLVRVGRLPIDVRGRLRGLTLTPASARRLVYQFERDPVGPAALDAVPKALRVLYLSPCHRPQL